MQSFFPTFSPGFSSKKIFTFWKFGSSSRRFFLQSTEWGFLRLDVDRGDERTIVDGTTVRLDIEGGDLRLDVDRGDGITVRLDIEGGDLRLDADGTAVRLKEAAVVFEGDSGWLEVAVAIV